MGAVCHTVNPRLAQDDISYIITHAGDCVVFADLSFVPLIAEIAPAINGCVKHVVLLADPAEMPALSLPDGMMLHCYEDLMAQSHDDFDWPDFDENTASALCYTSGTTGRPKGVLYSHRSAVLHALAVNAADGYGFRAMDRIFMATSMFHATAWAWPYVAAMCRFGADHAGTLAGRRHRAGHAERGTRYLLRRRAHNLAGCARRVEEKRRRPALLKRLMVAGSACPRVLIEGFGAYGVDVYQAWGMTETSPIVTHHATVPATADLDAEAATRLRLKQGRPIYGADIKIVDADGNELPQDGVAFGDLLTRGPWVCREYLYRGSRGRSG